MGERIKIIRKSLGLSQEAFGEKVGVTKTAICALEANRRNLTEQMAKSICREFNVNYGWLKHGEGEMFDNTPDTLLDEVIKSFDLDDIDRRIIIGYVHLNAEDRAAVKRYIQSIVDTK